MAKTIALFQLFCHYLLLKVILVERARGFAKGITRKPAKYENMVRVVCSTAQCMILSLRAGPMRDRFFSRSRFMKPEDFRQIISQAIDGEIEAYSFYCTVADKVADSALKNTFAELAGEELNHQDFLQHIMFKGSRALRVEESHDYQAANSPELPTLSAHIKPVDGILLAIRKKLDAMQMFTQLSEAASDPEDRHALLELAKMERGQKDRLEDIYARMAFPEAW